MSYMWESCSEEDRNPVFVAAGQIIKRILHLINGFQNQKCNEMHIFCEKVTCKGTICGISSPKLVRNKYWIPFSTNQTALIK